MQQNSGFSMAEAAKLLASAEGQQLLALLRQDGGNTLAQAAEAMQQIMALAQSMGLQGQNGPPQQAAPPTPAAPSAPPPQLPQLPQQSQPSQQPDPAQLIQGFLQLSRQSGGDERQLALFQAIKPFIRPDRAEKLDRAIQVARISRLAGNALQKLGPQILSGR